VKTTTKAVWILLFSCSVAFWAIGCARARDANISAHDTNVNSPDTSASAPASASTLVEKPSVDDSIFNARIRTAKTAQLDQLPIGERMVAVGKLFLGTPYVAGTLDIDSTSEHLILNLRGLDCVTFYENTLALARLIKKYPQPSIKEYENELTFLRYRGGKLNGYHSRLHYSIDYFYDNEKKGVLQNLTREIGGKLAKYDDRTINFMRTHRASYKQLTSNDSEYRAIAAVENEINARRSFYYIPKEDVAQVEKGIKTGDILGITTNIPALDCSHTGIAIRMNDGRIHFMHASSLKGQVIVSEEPLAEYLTHSSHQTGIIVNRPLEVNRIQK
jgi:hypothetical protein